MRRLRLAAAVALAPLVPAAPAIAAGDPIMPLAEVRSGMACTGLSVIRGTEPSAFDAEVLEVVGADGASSGSRILIRVSGPAVDATGAGFGFSGSPIYCPDAAGTRRVVGAMSESVGDFAGKLMLATPIEAILAQPAEPPVAADPDARSTSSPSSARRWRGRTVQPLTAPLTVSGLGESMTRDLIRRTAKRGVAVAAAPAAATSFPARPLVPGSAMAAAHSAGAIEVGAVGTVAYVDGDRVWGFGHALDGMGRRALFLQDAYVLGVINSPGILAPGGSYKLAVTGRTVGALTSDGFSAVVGVTGRDAGGFPMRAFVTDRDTGRRSDSAVRIADETDVGNPMGTSLAGAIAPLFLDGAITGAMGSRPAQVTAQLCVRVVLRESARPLRYCNRHVTTAQSSASPYSSAAGVVAATDLEGAIELLDSYRRDVLHVREMSARVSLWRGARLAYLQSLDAPARVRPGQRVRLRVTIQAPGAKPQARRFTARIPRAAEPGRRLLTLTGPDADSGEDPLEALVSLLVGDASADAGDAAEDGLGPASLEVLRSEFAALGRYDGLVLSIEKPRNSTSADSVEELEALLSGEDAGPSARAYRDARVRIAGTVSAPVRVVAAK
jgi:hypothetical protein